MSLAELKANSKDLGFLVNIPSSRTLRSNQPFLGKLINNSRFIEDFPIYASVLYELSEEDFHEIRRMTEMESPMPNEERVDDRKCQGDSDLGRIGVTGGDLKFSCVPGCDLTSIDRSRW